MIQCQETLGLDKDNYTFLLLSLGIILIIHLHTCYCLRMVMVKTTDTNVLLLFHVFQSMKKMIEYPFYCYLYKTISKNNVAYMFIVLDYIYANIIYIWYPEYCIEIILRIINCLNIRICTFLLASSANNRNTCGFQMW